MDNNSMATIPVSAKLDLEGSVVTLADEHSVLNLRSSLYHAVMLKFH